MDCKNISLYYYYYYHYRCYHRRRTKRNNVCISWIWYVYTGILRADNAIRQLL